MLRKENKNPCGTERFRVRSYFLNYFLELKINDLTRRTKKKARLRSVVRFDFFHFNLSQNWRDCFFFGVNIYDSKLILHNGTLTSSYYPQGYGKADHEIAVSILKKTYPHYSITWSDEGYWIVFNFNISTSTNPRYLHENTMKNQRCINFY